MKITLYNTQKDLLIAATSVKRLVVFLLKKLRVFCDELIIHLVSERSIRLIHKKFFNDPSTTDCISFSIDSLNEKPPHPVILGEIFVCPKVAVQYGNKHDVDPYEETSRYIVHCILHLIGYDDKKPKQLRNMRLKENACMNCLKQNQLLLYPSNFKKGC